MRAHSFVVYLICDVVDRVSTEEGHFADPLVSSHFTDADAAILISDLAIALHSVCIERSLPNLALLVSKGAFTMSLTLLIDATSICPTAIRNLRRF